MIKKYNIRIPKGKEVKNVKTDIVNGNINVSFDIEDIFEPKDGDFLHDEYRDVTVIYKESNESGGIITYAGIGKCLITTYIDRGWGEMKSFRYATEKEKQSFLKRLENECGKTWNADKKCLEDIYVPKFGDIVCIEHPDIEGFSRKYVISIFPNKEIPNENRNCFFDIACVNMDGKLKINSEAYYNHGHIRKASESEKQELFEKLKEAGKRWNEETKKLEDIRWRAEENELYYYLIVGNPTIV